MLYLVRHGRTDANAQGLLQGRLDPPLDDVGRAQAGAIARLIGQVDEVIEPRETRVRLIRALEVLRTKVQSTIPKKHGLFPV